MVLIEFKDNVIVVSRDRDVRLYQTQYPIGSFILRDRSVRSGITFVLYIWRIRAPHDADLYKPSLSLRASLLNELTTNGAATITRLAICIDPICVPLISSLVVHFETLKQADNSPFFAIWNNRYGYRQYDKVP
jgi:hypothetical protein